LNFYKLLFLGSHFAEKMLNIKIPEGTGKKKEISIEPHDEELKSDSSGGFIIDTSDMTSSDGGGLGKAKTSPSSNDSISGPGDPYQKIKNHSLLCLQYLFRNNSKALFNYWYLLFPSFFTRA
jgi:hypothetical protein